MFEIGNSLREARLRQGLDLSRVEEDTKIRTKYLQALEAERFEVLPGETYVKGFLRTYAEYLGLDGQLYVDEFNSRFASVEEPVLASTAPRRQRARASESNFVVVALAGIVAVTILVVVAFGFSSGTPSDPAANLGNAPGTAGADGNEGSGSDRTTRPEQSKRTPALARLVLRAAGGESWVQVNRGSIAGPYLWGGTIEAGQAQRFTGKRLWIQLGRAENIVATVNGRRVTIPADANVVLVTPTGIRVQA